MTISSVNKKSPADAALLNFFALGMGYVYLGIWSRKLIWLIVPIVLTNWVATVLSLGATQIFSMPLQIALAWHAYHKAKEMNAKSDAPSEPKRDADSNVSSSADREDGKQPLEDVK